MRSSFELRTSQVEQEIATWPRYQSDLLQDLQGQADTKAQMGAADRRRVAAGGALPRLKCC